MRRDCVLRSPGHLGADQGRPGQRRGHRVRDRDRVRALPPPGLRPSAAVARGAHRALQHPPAGDGRGRLRHDGPSAHPSRGVHQLLQARHPPGGVRAPGARLPLRLLRSRARRGARGGHEARQG